jgi:hypothetical protein
MLDTKTVLVSCGIFREELEYLAREGLLDGDTVFLDAALHVNFDKLKEQLVRTLDGNCRKDCDVKVLYGACHPEMAEILERYGAKRMAANNCLEALVGADEMRRHESAGKTFFLSAGWINNWEEMFALGKEDFDFDFQAMFRPYERVLVFETGVIPIDEVKLQRFKLFTRLPVERTTISLDHLVAQLQNV